jgi:hypothetical protein
MGGRVQWWVEREGWEFSVALCENGISEARPCEHVTCHKNLSLMMHCEKPHLMVGALSSSAVQIAWQPHRRAAVSLPVDNIPGFTAALCTGRHNDGPNFPHLEAVLTLKASAVQYF